MGIRVTHPEIIPALLDVLPPGWKPSTTRNVQWLLSWVSKEAKRKRDLLIHTLYTGPYHLTQGSDFQRIKYVLAADVQANLALRSPWRVFIHAGVVGWKGRAIVIPGHSESGKTTLTRTLVEAGATLYSDEFAVLDRKGRVHPYPLPLRVREGGGPRSRRVSAEDLGGRAGTRPLPVGLILATRFDPGATGILRRISPGRAALALLAHANQARTRTGRVLETVRRAAEEALALQGPRGEAEKTMDRILSFW